MKRKLTFWIFFALLFLSSIGTIVFCFSQKREKTAAIVIPHNPPIISGWQKSIQKYLKYRNYDLIFLFAPNHKNVGPAIMTDGVLGRKQESGINLPIINQEQAIKVSVPLLKSFYPSAEIRSLIFRRGLTLDQLKNLAATLKERARFHKTLFVGSIDFSHYVDRETATANDRQTLNLLEKGSFTDILKLGDNYLDCPACLVLLAEIFGGKTNHFSVLSHDYLDQTSYFFLEVN